MFDPWSSSFDDAQSAQEDCESASQADPTGPIYQWSAARNVEAERQAVESGDGFAVLSCISRCVTHGLVAPKWLAVAYNRHYHQVLNCRVRSWDEAFGKPYPGKDLEKLRQRRELRFKVYSRVNKLHRDENRPIDDALFAAVGAEFGIRKTLCSKLYSEAKQIAPLPLLNSRS